MASINTAKNLRGLVRGDHLCFLYSTEEQQREVMSEYIRLGIQRKEQVIYIRDHLSTAPVPGMLSSSKSECERCLESGQLRIIAFRELYERKGVFESNPLPRFLRNATAKALAQGWSGARITIETDWALRYFPGLFRTAEFESRCNNFCTQNRCLLMCQYDRRRLIPEILLYALATHPLALVGKDLYENLFYRIPPSFIGQEPASRILSYWLSGTGPVQRERSA